MTRQNRSRPEKDGEFIAWAKKIFRVIIQRNLCNGLNIPHFLRHFLYSAFNFNVQFKRKIR
ncbi:MAG: hypothetical protein LBF88_08325 [Planctomycetaceae bacterium]|jgi:hypothetical protein|nr:hypothetical protein [Planctomycetaceae bacterium]